MKKIIRSRRHGGFIVLALAVAMMGGAAHAEDPIPTELAASEAQEFMGIWKVTVEVMGFEIEMYLNITEIEGQVGATLDSARQPEPLAISSIQKIDDRLDINSELTFGTIIIDINMNLGLENGNLTGMVEDAGGLIKAAVLGVPFTEEQLSDVQGTRPPPTEARLNVGGKRIRIAFANLNMDSSDWELFQEVEDGQVYQFTLSRATKIYTDMDLDFGGKVVKSGNMSEDYPGVYSLWLKRKGDGWTLVFNEQPDIWGTKYIAEHDAVEIPLQTKEIAGDPVEKFIVTLDKEGDSAAKLVMQWGNVEWSTDVKLLI